MARFEEQPKDSESSRRVIAVALFAVLVLWTCYGLDRPIGNGDECMHAEILRTMMRSGDYLRTRWYGVVLHERPPMTYWLAVPFVHLLPGEWGVRGSSACASLLTLVVVYRAASQLWQQPRAAVCATLLLAGAPSYHVLTRTLLSEAPYVLALTCALLATIWAQRDARPLIAVAVSLGAATALKGLAVVVPVIALTPWLLRAYALHGDRRTLLYALGLFVLLALPYFALGLALDAPQFMRQHVEFHLLKSTQPGQLGIGTGAFTYLRALQYRDGPVITGLMGSGAVLALWYGRDPARVTLTILGSYTLAVCVLTSLLGTRSAQFMLPMYPSAMLCVAGVLSVASERFERLRQPHVSALALLLAVVVVLSSSRYPGGSRALLESPYGKLLGQRVRQTAPEERVYAYEWNGLSLGYYADRPVLLVTESPERFATMNFDLSAVARGRIAALVPPLPARPGSRLLLAGVEAELRKAAWLVVDEVLATAPPYALVHARVR